MKPSKKRKAPPKPPSAARLLPSAENVARELAAVVMPRFNRQEAERFPKNRADYNEMAKFFTEAAATMIEHDRAVQRNAAFEDAAAICQAEFENPNWHENYLTAAKMCATAILKLKRHPPARPRFRK